MRLVYSALILTLLLVLSGCNTDVEPTQPPAPPSAEPAAPAVEPSPVVVGTAPGRDAPADVVAVADLPLGVAGEYVNLTYGYRLSYPETWFTGFGNRPILVSFSDLDPGENNRDSMRARGCLIEVSAATNVFGLSLVDVVAQMPRSFPNAEGFELDGAWAVRGPRQAPDGAGGERVQVAHGDMLYNITLDYAAGAEAGCREAWDGILASWSWIEPELNVYRNPDRGFGLSYPRSWAVLADDENGLIVTSVPEADGEDFAVLAEQGMVVSTRFFANEENLPLKEWLAANTDGIGRSNDVPLNTLIGVRTLRTGELVGTQEMIGTFQGPEGNIIVITCAYPSDRQWEFRPIANAVLYSFNY
jgi:hypothetical protein